MNEKKRNTGLALGVAGGAGVGTGVGGFYGVRELLSRKGIKAGLDRMSDYAATAEDMRGKALNKNIGRDVSNIQKQSIADIRGRQGRMNTLSKKIDKTSVKNKIIKYNKEITSLENLNNYKNLKTKGFVNLLEGEKFGDRLNARAETRIRTQKAFPGMKKVVT